jgi:hypothetical protein
MFAAPISKPERAAAPVRGMLQRKCACGARAKGGGSCASCADKNERLQRKLAIGWSNDPLEHEADRVAEQVMAGPARSDFSRVPISVQRHAPSAAPQGRDAPASVDRVLAMAGRPLDAPLRRDMETRFGSDFSQVRVHQGGAAEQSARDVEARAYTVDHDIVFGAGEYAPQSASGRHLLAHELAHVLQQGGSSTGIVRAKTAETPEADLQTAAPIETAEAQPEADSPIENAPEADSTPDKATMDAAAKALGNWGKAYFNAAFRFNRWLVNNLVKFHAEYFEAKKEADEGIKNQVTKAVTDELTTWGIERVVAKVITKAISAAFLVTRTAKFLGGVFTIAIAMLLDKVWDIVFGSKISFKTVSEANLIVFNKAFDDLKKANDEKTAFSELVRGEICSGKLPASTLASTKTVFESAEKTLDSVYTDPDNESLYYKLMLSNELLPWNEVIYAQTKPMEKIGGNAEKIDFKIQREKTWDEDKRVVPSDGSTITIEIASRYCYNLDYDNRHPDAPGNWITFGPELEGWVRPPDIFEVKLVPDSWLGGNEYPTRWFEVESKQFATWYNVSKGSYRLRVTRHIGGMHFHRIGLCGEGEFRVAKQ